MGLAKRMAASDQGNSFFIAHRHSRKRLANVECCRDRVRLAVWPLRIDVNEAHLDGSERILQLTLAAIPFIAEPRSLRTPIKLLRLPCVLTSAAKTEGLEAH